MSLEIAEIAKLAATAAIDKKAIDTVILDIKDISLIADYFIICSGNSEVQVQAIATEIKDVMNKQGVEVRGMVGLRHARWVLIDLGDVVVHIFHREDRAFYNLERLWADAPRVSVEELV